MMKYLFTLVIVFQMSILCAQKASHPFFVGAQHGLIARDAPNTDANRIGKFGYTSEVKLLQRTDKMIQVMDHGNQVRGRWFKVSGMDADSDSLLTGYVFSGFLSSEKIYAQTKTIKRGNYRLTISESDSHEFESIPIKSQSHWLSEEECIKRGLVSIKSSKEIVFRLLDHTYFELKGDDDEQFGGYGFMKYDSLRGLYLLYESWLEAGQYTIINAKNGKITYVYGEVTESDDQNIIATSNLDIGAGWTANGIQVLEIKANTIVQLFEFNPLQALDQLWGPSSIKWASKNEIFAACRIHNCQGGYMTIYKKLEFEKIK